MTERYNIHFAWDRFDPRKAILVILLVLLSCFSAFFFTARPAEAKRANTVMYKYYTDVTVRQGDTLWKIAEEQMDRKETSSQYRNTRAYMKEVIDLNRLYDGNYLLAGQKLVVPYYSTEIKN